MEKLFTPLGEDWERLWHGYAWREATDFYVEDGFNSDEVIDKDVKRADQVGEYFCNMQTRFEELGYNKENPYVSGDIVCPTFSKVVDNARALYILEVGGPSKELARYLSSSKIRNCMTYHKDKNLLEEIAYRALEYEVTYLDGYVYDGDYYPSYRVDTLVRIINWVKSQLKKGKRLDDLRYCQYHGDRVPGERDILDTWRARKEEGCLFTYKAGSWWFYEYQQQPQEFGYREEIIRNLTLMPYYF